MNDTEVGAAVTGFFTGRGIELPADETARASYEYLDTGVLDSMGIVAMVMEMEQRFGIRFAAEDMQSVDFRTIGGLISLIEHRRADAGDV